MRVFVRRPLAFAIVSLAAVLSARVLGQAVADAPAPGATSPAEVDEVTVRGRKTMTQYRLEIERARDEVFRLYNEANEGESNDITCRAEQPTGSRMRQDVCRSEAENKAHAGAARDFLDALLMGSGMNKTGAPVGSMPGPVLNSNIGTGVAQAAGQSGERDALAAFEQEWTRLLGENRQLYRAVVKYAELQDEYNRARGSTSAAIESAPAVVLEEAIAPAAAAELQCEASTLTEYQQRNNVARVKGTVSISICPAGTTGSFTLVARVRDDNGEIKPLEFNETWQRSDAQDHIFSTDYPIGENVELMSVRVRGLACTCAEAAQ